MTLLGFVRENRFNIYCGAQRIEGAQDSGAENFESVKFEKAKASVMTAQ